MNWLGIVVLIIFIALIVIFIIIAVVSAMRNENKGTTGNTGNTGSSGTTGTTGSTGSTGSTGTTGSTGSSGSTGSTGSSGSSGDTGTTGGTTQIERIVPRSTPVILENQDSLREEEMIYLSEVHHQTNSMSMYVPSFKFETYKCIDVVFHDYNYYLLSCGEKIIVEYNNIRTTVMSSMKLKQLEVLDNSIYALTENGNLVKLLSSNTARVWLWDIIESKVIWLQYIENNTFWLQKKDTKDANKYTGYFYDITKKENVLIIPNLKYRRIYSDVGNTYIDFEPNLHIQHNLPDDVYNLTLHNGNPYFIYMYEKDIYSKFIKRKNTLLKLER